MEVEERPPVSLQSIRKEMEGCGSLVEFKPFPIMTGKPPITSICASCHASGAALCCKNCRYFYFCSSECAKNCNSRHLERCANMEPTINDAVNAMFRESRISEPAPHEVFWLTSHGIDLKQFVPTAANLPNVTTTHRLFEPLLLRDTQKWDAELKAWRCAVWASEIKQDLVREVLMKTGMPSTQTLSKMLATHFADLSDDDGFVFDSLFRAGGENPDVVRQLLATMLQRGANFNQLFNYGCSILHHCFANLVLQSNGPILVASMEQPLANAIMEPVVAYERRIRAQLVFPILLPQPLIDIVFRYCQVDFGL